MKKNIFLIISFFVLNPQLMGMENKNEQTFSFPSAISRDQYFKNAQDSNTGEKTFYGIHFPKNIVISPIEGHNSSLKDKFIAAPVAGAEHAIQKVAAQKTYQGLDYVVENGLKFIFPPNHIEQFSEKKIIQDAKSQAFQLSIELLKTGRASSQMLSKQEAQRVKAILDEIENNLLSPEYFAQQGQKFFLAKFIQLNQLQQDYIAPINYIAEMFGEANNVEKQKYRDLLHNKIQEFSISLHNAIVQEPIDQGIDWSDYKGAIGFGTGIVTGGAIVLGILFKLGVLVLPGGS
jgi:hypothetical protein